MRVQILALPDDYVEHGNVDVLRKETDGRRIHDGTDL